MQVCNRKRLLLLLLTACLLISSLLPLAGLHAEAAHKTGTYITIYESNFRSAPSFDSKIYGVVPQHTTVTVTKVEGQWGYISYNGRNGWISLAYSKYYPVSNKPKLATPMILADFSSWTLSKQINWAQLKKDGVSGVILRIGGRGYGGSKSIYKDDLFYTHYKNAKAVGMHVGVYFFSYAMTSEGAREEARFTINRLKSCGCDLDLPVFIDLEDIDRREQHYRAGKAVCTAVADAFCNEIRKAGYYPGIYTGKWFAEALLDTQIFENRALWIAQYGVSKCGYTDAPIDIWQYTDKGRISGVSVRVDLNRCYVDFPSMIKKPSEPETEPTPTTTAPPETTTAPPEPTTVPEPVYAPDAFGVHVLAKDWSTAKAATCTKNGVREKICTDCGITLLSEITQKAAHKPSAEMLLLSADAAPGDILSEKTLESLKKAETNGAQGTRLTYCTVCKTVLSAQYDVPGCKHANKNEKTEQPTCAKPGARLTVCRDCGKTLAGELLPTASHKADDPIVISENCTEGGERVTYCADCGTELNREYRKPQPHKYAVSEYIEMPTLFKSGSANYECTVCGKTRTGQAKALQLGDVTGDGAVTAADARIALRIAVELEKTDAVSRCAGDIDNDGAITARDARLALRIAVDLEKSDALLREFYPDPEEQTTQPEPETETATAQASTEPPETEPTATQPTTEPPTTEQTTTLPPTEPPVTEPTTTLPQTEPPVTEPTTMPPQSEPPATEPTTMPPQSEPPATEPTTMPPQTEPHATEPTTAQPPVEQPAA